MNGLTSCRLLDGFCPIQGWHYHVWPGERCGHSSSSAKVVPALCLCPRNSNARTCRLLETLLVQAQTSCIAGGDQTIPVISGIVHVPRFSKMIKTRGFPMVSLLQGPKLCPGAQPSLKLGMCQDRDLDPTTAVLRWVSLQTKVGTVPSRKPTLAWLPRPWISQAGKEILGFPAHTRATQLKGYGARGERWGSMRTTGTRISKMALGPRSGMVKQKGIHLLCFVFFRKPSNGGDLGQVFARVLEVEKSHKLPLATDHTLFHDSCLALGFVGASAKCGKCLRTCFRFASLFCLFVGEIKGKPKWKPKGVSQANQKETKGNSRRQREATHFGVLVAFGLGLAKVTDEMLKEDRFLGCSSTWCQTKGPPSKE